MKRNKNQARPAEAVRTGAAEKKAKNLSSRVK